MRRGRWLAFAAYLAIVVLVTGGLAYVTHKALQLEQSDTLRLALWRLDSRMFQALAREDSRPIAHYDPLYPPLPALDRTGKPIAIGTVLVPSPLLSADLPPWMALHFSADSMAGWRSPQVIAPQLAERLRTGPYAVDLTNVNASRAELLTQLKAQFPTETFIGSGKQQIDWQMTPVQTVEANPDSGLPGQQQSAVQSLQNEFASRASQQSKLRNEGRGYEGNNSFNYIPQSGVFFAEKEAEWSVRVPMGCVMVTLESMEPRWMTGHDGVERLMLLRPFDAKGLFTVQGVLLDWPKLQEVLLEEVRDLFPNARLEPANGESGDRMTALPVRLVVDSSPIGWPPLHTPMRLGLALGWACAALALAVVGLGGWSLLDLSERRFRFVTAVTHELRTPLTTLRLYTDMLTSGLVKDSTQRDEYLATLNTEAERLHRLIGNVLDFARLERQSPKINRRPHSVAAMLDGLRADWECRCQSAGKELTIELTPGCPDTITTDPDLVRQILGNLIDNACKYSRGADDPRIRVRARCETASLVFTVEDRGPGVERCESRSVFRPFTRGHTAPETAGGVGLGLALAARWAHLLGGRLALAPSGAGACFQLKIPL